MLAGALRMGVRISARARRGESVRSSRLDWKRVESAGANCWASARHVSFIECNIWLPGSWQQVAANRWEWRGSGRSGPSHLGRCYHLAGGSAHELQVSRAVGGSRVMRTMSVLREIEMLADEKF